MKKISIITPCRNAERFIGETVESVLTQSALLSGRAELEYIICDGLSTDRTVAIAEAASKGFRYGSVRILSRSDHGMYEALAGGLRMATGEICTYINAGDFYDKHAFDVVLDIFDSGRAEWLTGLSVNYNEQSQLVGISLPFRYRTRLFACGVYGRMLPFVQQESTFWSSRLHQFLDFERLARFRSAGDYYLWHQFAGQAELKVVLSHLGGFRTHRGQLSQDMAAYQQEMGEILGGKKPNPLDLAWACFDAVMWKAPIAWKKKLNPHGLFCFSHDEQRWV
ncbi:MAG TPA: glycosyltransferase [Desulfuromonadales bacterium]|nr:glycosyltransferase [Desulfuromonadales bacterium]